MKKTRCIVNGMAIAAIVFGALTALSGGRGLFGSAEARAALGSTVPFVLWFNFLAGFVYIIAGAGLLLQRRWAVSLSLLIAIFTSLIFAAFGFHVIQGRAFEMRTVGALTLRTLFWVAVAMVAMHAQRKHECERFSL